MAPRLLRRLPASVATAAAIALALVVWMLSGRIIPGEQAAPSKDDVGLDVPLTVAVRQSSAEAVTRYLINQGQSEPDRAVQVRAETGGQVEALPVARGSQVDEGAVLVRIAMEDRQARLREAQALVEQREAEHEAARSLGKGGYQARTRVKEAAAALAAARARLADIRHEIADTEVRAPFAGILEDRMVEVGDYVDAGDPVARVVDLDPLEVSVHIAQQRIEDVSRGGPARVRFADGRGGEGRISYVARTADEATRTFRVEVALANPASAIPAGLSAEVRIPVAEVPAHFVSPALLALGDEGQLGIKAVDEDERVVFHAVEIVRAEPDGVWVSGLPDQARLITVGQGFARRGDPVRTVDGEASPVPVPGPVPAGPLLPEPPEAPPS